MGIFGFLTNLFSDKDRSTNSQLAHRPDLELWEAIDQVVKLAHDKVSRVRNYRKKLQPGVERTLEYTNELISRIPGPEPVNLDSWGKNPLIHALFTSNEELKGFFTGNKKLDQVLENARTEHIYALLTATLQEKKILGIEQDGNIIKRDVPQVAVNFLDHKLLAPSAAEKDTRKELTLKVLTLLSTHAMEEILSLKSWQQEIEDQMEILEVKLEVHEANVRSAKSLFEGGLSEAVKKEAKEVLGQLDEKLQNVKSKLNPEDCLEQIKSVLEHPEKYLQSETYQMRVSDLGIKLGETSSVPGNTFEINELTLNGEISRIMQLIQYSHK
jgi:hypothetical protein